MRYGLDDHDHSVSPVKREEKMELAEPHSCRSRSLRLQSWVVHLRWSSSDNT
nr:MAG TPA: hypothetical protein [Caudoviricetes sp.]